MTNENDLNFKQLKLVNGEEIAGFVLSETENEIIIEQPHVIQIREDTGTIRMRRWFEMSEQTVYKIPSEQVLMVVELDTSYKDYFLNLLAKQDIDDLFESIDADKTDAELDKELADEILNYYKGNSTLH